SGEESHARPAVARRLRERVTHPSARTVGDEPNRVEPLAGRSGGDEDAQALQVTPRRARERERLVHDSGRLGHPTRPFAARTEKAPARTHEARAARPEELQA